MNFTLKREGSNRKQEHFRSIDFAALADVSAPTCFLRRHISIIHKVLMLLASSYCERLSEDLV